MSTIVSQITSITIVCSTVYPGAKRRKHQSFASLAFVWRTHRWMVNSPHKGPATRKCFHLMTSSWTQRLAQNDHGRRGNGLSWINHTTVMSLSVWVHDDVIKWEHFPRYSPFGREIHRSPATSPHKGQWRGTLMFSLICAWINSWVNNGEVGDLRRHRANYDVTVMGLNSRFTNIQRSFWIINSFCCITLRRRTFCVSARM